MEFGPNQTIFSPDQIDDFIRNAWDNKPRHYGGKFPLLEKEAQKLASKAALEFFQMPYPVFVRVRDTQRCMARYTCDPPRCYVTMTKKIFHARQWQLADGTPYWVTTLLHELSHIEDYRWYRGDGHGPLFQTIERQVLNAYGLQPEYTRTPGYWRRLYDLSSGRLLFDKIEQGWFKA